MKEPTSAYLMLAQDGKQLPSDSFASPPLSLFAILLGLQPVLAEKPIWEISQCLWRYHDKIQKFTIKVWIRNCFGSTAFYQAMFQRGNMLMTWSSEEAWKFDGTVYSARTSTEGPASVMAGARMNTARKLEGPPSSDTNAGTGSCVSKLFSCNHVLPMMMSHTFIKTPKPYTVSKFRMHAWSCLVHSVEEEAIINSLTLEILNAANWPDSMIGRGRENYLATKKVTMNSTVQATKKVLTTSLLPCITHSSTSNIFKETTMLAVPKLMKWKPCKIVRLRMHCLIHTNWQAFNELTPLWGSRHLLHTYQLPYQPERWDQHKFPISAFQKSQTLLKLETASQ